MNHLSGKTLLVMDRTALAACAVKRANELGIRTIVANFYPTTQSPSKQIADIAIDIDISDINAMLTLIKDYNIDGIFVGWTDSHLPFYYEICHKAGLPCCGTKEQFDILSNDKRLFKSNCRKYGVPTIPEYNLDYRLLRKDLDKIEYPIIVKPADESGSRGVKRCDNEEELVTYYSELYASSKSKKIICEKFIASDKEIFIHYTVQNGKCSLSSAFMKHKSKYEVTAAASAILHVFPSSYIELYRETTESSVVRMIEGLGIQNAVLNYQGFIDDDKFYFYESGLRMGGEQHYIFSSKLNGINALDMMIEFSLTGKITCANVLEQDNANYSKSCCNYYVTLKPGVIKTIEGIEEIENWPQVLQILTFHSVGDEISSTNSLDRVIYRMHVMDDTKEKLAEALQRISSTLRIRSENDEEMQIEELTYERAYEMISNS